MDYEEKRLRLEALNMALEDLNKIIDSMTENGYSKEQINEYHSKRWNLYSQITQLKKV